MRVTSCRDESIYRKPCEIQGVPSERVEREYVPQFFLYAGHLEELELHCDTSIRRGEFWLLRISSTRLVSSLVCLSPLPFLSLVNKHTAVGEGTCFYHSPTAVGSNVMISAVGNRLDKKNVVLISYYGMSVGEIFSSCCVILQVLRVLYTEYKTFANDTSIQSCTAVPAPPFHSNGHIKLKFRRASE